MAKRPTTDPALRDLKQELLRTTDALKDAYTRFNCVCDSELIEASIYEISALKARCNYLLRRIKELSGEAVPSAIPRARPVQAAAAAASAPEETHCIHSRRGEKSCQRAGISGTCPPVLRTWRTGNAYCCQR